MTSFTKVLIAIGSTFFTFSLLVVAKEMTTPTIAAAAQENCSPFRETSAPAINRSDADIKNEKIVNAVQRFAVYSGDLKIDITKVRDADEAAGKSQWYNKVAERFGDLATYVEVNNLSGYTVGFTTKDALAKQKLAYAKSLHWLRVTKRLGGTNMCLWEGGCLDRSEIVGTEKMLRKKIAN